jgi:hypothetical protein
VKCEVEDGVVLMGVAFRELPDGRSRWRLPQSRDRGLQGSTHCGYCVHGSHLLPMDHKCQDASTLAARVRIRHHADCRVAVERAADRYVLICDGPYLVPRRGGSLNVANRLESWNTTLWLIPDSVTVKTWSVCTW